MMNQKAKITSLWQQLYSTNYPKKLEAFLEKLEQKREALTLPKQEDGWYKDAVVYSLYVDLFNTNFAGLTQKLDYIQNLGANCIWLLPILDSPMRDAGFDIKNYTQVRADLLGLSTEASEEEKRAIFQAFLDEAHRRKIRVIFDIAMNHCSEEHPWFVEAKKGEDNPFRDFFIWSDTTEKYSDARLLFKGMCPSNWEPHGDAYYFHRFFEFQPDLNYRNPDVLTNMSENLLFWLSRGIDGFRADAIPYLWKEEGTDCENLENTHTIVKFFRAVLDYLRPNTLLLAEACQAPKNVVKYFSDGDECHAGYHFPLMPQMFKALAMQSGEPVKEILSESVTPAIPDESQWFTFLRCHDELSLELVYVSEKDRAYIHKSYCYDPKWDFRLGEGISARLSDLMQQNADKIELIYSLMLSLPGTPIIYYGDEFGKGNDEAYYRDQIQMTGKDDTRFLVRGRVDWKDLEQKLADKNSFQSDVFNRISALLKVRNSTKAFGRGKLEFAETNDKGILAFTRTFENEKILAVFNLTEREMTTTFSLPSNTLDMFENPVDLSAHFRLNLNALSAKWIKL